MSLKPLIEWMDKEQIRKMKEELEEDDHLTNEEKNDG